MILDRLGALRRSEVKVLIESAQCWLVFLPSYSPNFNPIEFAFSWLKARLRSVGARSARALVAGIGRASALIDGVLTGGWFAGMSCNFQPLPKSL